MANRMKPLMLFNLLALLLLAAACTTPPAPGAVDGGNDATAEAHETHGDRGGEHKDEHGDHADEHSDHEGDAPPDIDAVPLAEGERLQVAASTNIVADVVAQVGGDRIELMRIITVGSDPHGFQPTPQSLIALNEAHVIFVNGLNLEEPLLPVLETLDGEGVIISVNAGVETLDLGEDGHGHEEAEHRDASAEQDAPVEEEHDGHDHGGVDPHTWFSVLAVAHWVENIEQALAALDPAGAVIYAANAETYLLALDALGAELDSILAQLPAEKRVLITDHDSLGYFADAYGFEVIGTVIPSLSTLASPSAKQMAELQAQIEAAAVPAIFVGSTANADLAEQIAADVGIEVAPIYTGSLSDAEGPASTYIDFMRHNVNTIVNALK